MHEMSLVRNIVDAVVQECDRAGVTSVKTVRLTIGELHDVIQELVPDLFRHLAKGTAAADADVVIETVSTELNCTRCSSTFRADPRRPMEWRCPSCGATGCFTIRRGMEFYIDSIEVDEEGMAEKAGAA